MAIDADHDFVSLQQALAGDYSLERELGRGGMGIVYLAREVQLDRLVAIKVLRPERASHPHVRARFLREARLAASLSHPNIVQIYRVIDRPELTCITMQAVDGTTLGERLRRRGPMQPTEASTMLREVAWALAHAHGRGIVHRDVKPDNILLERESGRALVGDFGIATARADEGAIDAESVMGSAHFMSPEQGNRTAVDGRSDLYSLGVVGYLTLSGRFPFHGATLGELLARQGRDVPPSLAVAAPTVPRRLVLAIDSCLRIAPDERVASAERFAEALEESRIARKRLPAELQAWVEARSPWAAINVVWTLFWAGRAIDSRAESAMAWTLAALPPLIAGLLRVRVARQLLGAGYTVTDMRIALQSAEEQEHRDRSERAALESRWSRRVFRWTAWSLAGVTAAWMFVNTVGIHLPSGLAKALLGSRMLFGAVLVGGLVSLPLGYALGIPLAPGLRPVARFRQLFWSSRVGEMVARMLTPAHRGTPTELAHRPTEIALGMAVEELFRALPSPYRDTITDLPGVVRRLEGHARQARAALAMYSNPVEGEGSGAQPDEARGPHAAARGALRDAISALESIRVHLLRVHGGVADLQPITTVLDAARRVGDDLDRLTVAQREVGISPHRLGLDLPTPTPA